MGEAFLKAFLFLNSGGVDTSYRKNRVQPKQNTFVTDPRKVKADQNRSNVTKKAAAYIHVVLVSSIIVNVKFTRTAETQGVAATLNCLLYSRKAKDELAHVVYMTSLC